jgi:hypothetical protein
MTDKKVFGGRKFYTVYLKRQFTCYECISPFAGARGGVVIKALRYKPAGRGFDSRLCHWNFSVT